MYEYIYTLHIHMYIYILYTYMYIKILIITEKNEHRPAVRLSSKLDMQFKRTFQIHAIIIYVPKIPLI